MITSFLVQFLGMKRDSAVKEKCFIRLDLKVPLVRALVFLHRSLIVALVQGLPPTVAAGGLRAPPRGQTAELQRRVQKCPGRQVRLCPEVLLPHHPQFCSNQVNGFTHCSAIIVV